MTPEQFQYIEQKFGEVQKLQQSICDQIEKLKTVQRIFLEREIEGAFVNLNRYTMAPNQRVHFAKTLLKGLGMSVVPTTEASDADP